MRKNISRWIFLTTAWIYVGLVALQVLLAGLGVFTRTSGARFYWEFHAGLGHLLLLGPIVLLITVFLGRFRRRTKWLTFTIALVYFLMADVIIFIETVPFVRALHPVLAVLLLALTVRTAGKARDEIREDNLAEVLLEQAA